MPRENSKIVEFFRKIGNAILNIKKFPKRIKNLGSSLRLGSKRPKKKIPSFLQGFFRRRNAGWPEYVILKVQICVIILFAISAIFAIFPGWAPEVVFIPLILILAGYVLYLVPTEVKRAFKRDYPAYRAFVGMILIIIFVLVFVLRYLSFGVLESPYMAMMPVILVVGSVLVAFAGFKLRYGRDYTYGVVERTKGSKAAVKVSYDIRSNIKHGLYFLETLVKVKPGDKVKVGVNRSLWGFRGSEPTAILEKVK